MNRDFHHFSRRNCASKLVPAIAFLLAMNVQTATGQSSTPTGTLSKKEIPATDPVAAWQDTTKMDDVTIAHFPGGESK